MNLHSLRILVTRPRPQGEILCEKIRAAQGQAIYLPTIEITPPKELFSFQEAIASLDQLDYLIFISPHAVMQSITYIRAIWPVFPSGIQVAAVGAGTANALSSEEYFPAPLFPKQDWRTEGLLALPEFQHLLNKKIGIVRGENGRPLLSDTLSARGALISHLIAYERSLPTTPVDEYIRLFQSGSIDIMVCTSNEGLQNLLVLMGKEIKQAVLKVPVVVVSERMLVHAKDLGFQKVVLAENASHDGILAAIAF